MDAVLLDERCGVLDLVASTRRAAGRRHHTSLNGEDMSGHGHIEDGGSKRIGLLISVLALCLAVVETGAKSTQTEALSANVESANLWSFFQARNIRQTVVRTAAESADLVKPGLATPAAREAIEKQQDKWRESAARWEDDPVGGEGRKQLSERAKHAEEERSLALAKYHMYEYAAAAFQVAIVVVSASVVTGVVYLALVGSGIAVIGLVLGLLGMLAPTLVHFP